MGDYNRVSLIYQDGSFDVISSKEFYNHYRYFMFYVMKKGSEIPKLIPLYQNATRNPFFYVQALLNYYRMIVILDTSFLDEEPISFGALVYLPFSISKEQYQMMKRQASYFNLYELDVMQCSYQEINIELLEELEEWDYNEFYSPGQYQMLLAVLQKKANQKIKNRLKNSN